MMPTSSDRPVVVVGGGLAGLATACLMARGGRRVTVLERAGALGGRARSTHEQGFVMNLGPHALYCGGAATRILAHLGVACRGRSPAVSGGFALDRGTLHALPGGFVSLLSTRLFGMTAKVETARLLAGIARLDPAAHRHDTVDAWLASHVRHPDVQRLVQALCRLTTYGHAPGVMSAELALEQLQSALARGVRYLDGGWGSLVEALRAAAEADGVAIRTDASAIGFERRGDGRITGVQVRGAATVPASAVVVALDAAAAATLLPEGSPRRAAAAAVPVRVACLDVGLSRLPRPRNLFALGIDQPLYYSVHSAAARLAPDGGALIHVARYLGGDDPEPKTVERQLEEALDLVQPGWRPLTVARRFLPGMVAASALATARDGGLGGRPGVAVPEVPNLFVAGDWVGPVGWLVDASLASARAAADTVLAAATRPHATAA